MKFQVLRYFTFGLIFSFVQSCQSDTSGNNQDNFPTYEQWHTITLPFEGPNTGESSEDNPFLNYRLSVDFTHGNSDYTIRGYYAADGDASNTSATSGNIWEVKFSPPLIGDWTYAAALYHGDSIALDNDFKNGERLGLNNASGNFRVTQSNKEYPDFRAKGLLTADDGYFRFKESGDYWIKGGANSPENLLAIEDFDGTYRIEAKAVEGEAAAPGLLHKYEAHLQDWKTGDATWKDGKGKALIGAMNYLASKGMNASYFLTMNILGDGKDVWPYLTPEEFTRFDVSKLAQWEVLFEYMQSKGILLHVVLQETENETMLDSGDTGPLRQLYYNELIARFGHHPGLIWNLGEENGPAPWAPEGQNDAQRKAMTHYIKKTDPYGHPVLLHTHSYDPLREGILSDIVGYKELDGLSLQVNIREGAPDVVQRWQSASEDAGKKWLITMDEIGEWHTATLTDAEDPWHPTLRRYALWGTLLSGGAGVEWYFGAHHPHNDLSSEDWRQRDQIWTLTDHAMGFFNDHIPYWEMRPDHSLVSSDETYCLAKTGATYAIYLPDTRKYTLDLTNTTGKYTISWYDPLKGGALQEGSVVFAQGGKVISLGSPPIKRTQDWVILVNRNVED